MPDSINHLLTRLSQTEKTMNFFVNAAQKNADYVRLEKKLQTKITAILPEITARLSQTEKTMNFFVNAAQKNADYVRLEKSSKLRLRQYCPK